MPSPLPYLDADTVVRHAPFGDVVEQIRAAFTRSGPGPLPRQQVALGDGDDLLLMPAAGDDAIGVKLLTVLPGNAAAGRPAIQGIYVLFDRVTGSPVALVDGAALTRLRTPAASAMATQALARPDVRRLAVFGTGVQARAHVPAMLWARPSITRVDVVGRTPDRAGQLATELRSVGHDAHAVDAVEGSRADVICTCTSSRSPVVVTGSVRDGAHVNAIGSYRPDQQELDPALVARARCVVDDVAAAREEAGDLIAAVLAGAISWDDVAGDLAGVAKGDVRRRSADEVTVFKSVGLAVEDLAAATLVARRAGLLG